MHGLAVDSQSRANSHQLICEIKLKNSHFLQLDERNTNLERGEIFGGSGVEEEALGAQGPEDEPDGLLGGVGGRGTLEPARRAAVEVVHELHPAVGLGHVELEEAAGGERGGLEGVVAVGRQDGAGAALAPRRRPPVQARATAALRSLRSGK